MRWRLRPRFRRWAGSVGVDGAEHCSGCHSLGRRERRVILVGVRCGLWDANRDEGEEVELATAPQAALKILRRIGLAWTAPGHRGKMWVR